MKILIIGAGGHGEVVADILKEQQHYDNNIRVIGFADRNSELEGKIIQDLKVFHFTDSVKHLDHDALILAVGNNQARKSLYESLKEQGESFTIAKHPSSTVSKSASIGCGSMISGNTFIGPGARIGENVILNTASSIDHHNIINDHSHIAPGVHTGGEVKVGEGTLVGIGATIVPRCIIGKWVTIGAGAVVINNIDDSATVVGVPAKIVHG